MDKEILEGNTIIAKFMGAKKRWFEFRGYHDASAIRDEPNPHLPMNQENGPYKKANKWYQHYKWQMNEKDTSGQFDSWLQYHSSWDWLMPVLEKIESAGLIVQIGHNSYCSIYGEFKEDAPWDGFHVSTDTDPIAGKVENKINGVWLCVVQFIQWYNSNQPQQ